MARVLPSLRSIAAATTLAATACGSTSSSEPGLEPIFSAKMDRVDRAPALPVGPDETHLDAVVHAKLKEAHVPGLAACVVRGGAVAWCKGYGMADVAAQRPVTPDTPFLLASVSKVFTATALMQRWELGGFNLDDDVSKVATFPVHYPGRPSGGITYRRLLGHVAGIADSDVMASFYAWGKDPSIPLEHVIEGYFVPGGDYYDAKKNFLPEPPGTAHVYSNMGFALLGYLEQARSGEDFAASTEKAIFQPLGMKDTSWRLGDFPPDSLAVPYGWSGWGFKSYGQYTFADYPNGALRSSARSVATFLASQARGGELGGHRILQSSTLQLMLDVAYPALDAHQGLGWYHREIGGADWVGHKGTESGVYTEMFMRPSDGLGFVLLTNGDVYNASPIHAVEAALIAFGQNLPI
jgi:CubicO group peptidase (beta-lactamase class C family)